MTKLSDHFTLLELTRSNTARRRGIDNTPNAIERRKLKVLCSVGLEVVRGLVNSPVRVSSGFRGFALNKAVGGSLRSQHCCRGPWAAADFEVKGLSNFTLAAMIRDSDIPFDQLILEYPEKGNPTAGWVHMSIRTEGQPRGDVLTATRVDGRTKYLHGLVL